MKKLALLFFIFNFGSAACFDGSAKEFEDSHMLLGCTHAFVENDKCLSCDEDAEPCVSPYESPAGVMNFSKHPFMSDDGSHSISYMSKHRANNPDCWECQTDSVERARSICDSCTGSRKCKECRDIDFEQNRASYESIDASRDITANSNAAIISNRDYKKHIIAGSFIVFVFLLCKRFK